jgi:hypothetical protein
MFLNRGLRTGIMTVPIVESLLLFMQESVAARDALHILTIETSRCTFSSRHGFSADYKTF